MKRAGLVVVMMSLAGAGCLEPGELSNAGEIYAAIGARNGDAAVPESGGSGGQSASGGMGGSGSGGMGGSGAGGMGGGDAAMPGECGDVLEDLIKPSCAGMFCHSTEAGGVLDLSLADGSHLIGAAASSSCDGHVYIDAENPEESLIYTKLDDPPPCGAQMPFSGAKFTDEDKACMLEYIQQVIADQ